MRSSPSLATGCIAAGTAAAAGAGADAAEVRALTAWESFAAAVAAWEGCLVAEPEDAPSTSAFTIRPAGPVPDTFERSTPFSSATLRARGEAFTRPPSEDAWAGAGVFSAGAASSFCSLAAGASSSGALSAAGAGAEPPSLSPSRTARTPPMVALSPSWIRISVSVPSSKASISMVALSVSTSARMSPISTWSPTFLCHLMRVPSVIVSESLGISIFTDMVWKKLVLGG